MIRCEVCGVEVETRRADKRFCDGCRRQRSILGQSKKVAYKPRPRLKRLSFAGPTARSRQVPKQGLAGEAHELERRRKIADGNGWMG